MEIPISIFKGRTKQVQKQAQEEKLSALIIYSSGSSLGFASQTHGYMRYLCDWDAKNQAAVLILLPEQKPILLVPGRSPQLFARETMWFDNIHAVPQTEFGKKIVSVLEPILKADEKIGYIGKSETPVALYDSLRNNLQRITLTNANHIIDQRRTVKDSYAIAFHRRSAQMCDVLFETFCQEVRSGKRVYQIQADLEHKAKYDGCEYASTFMSIGKVPDRPRYAKKECSHIPKEGDQVLLALFVLMDGHWGHAVRTGTIGKPSRAQQELFEITRKMQDSALEQVVPGNLLDKVWKASEKVLAQNFPDAREKDWYWLKTGHGLGLDYSDPILSSVFPAPSAMGKKSNFQGVQKDSQIKIMPGMLLELHPNIFLPDKATAAVGDMVLATKTGHEILTHFPRELMVL